MTTSNELYEYKKSIGRPPLVNDKLALGRMSQHKKSMYEALYTPKYHSCKKSCEDHEGRDFDSKNERAKYWGTNSGRVESLLAKGLPLKEALTKEVEKKPRSTQVKKTVSGHGRYSAGRFINNPELALTGGYVYLLLVIINNTYHLKVGITIQDISNKKKLSHHPKGSIIINQWYMPLVVCYLSEQKVLKSVFNQKIKLTQMQRFSGYTEVFTEICLNEKSFLISINNFIELQMTTSLYLYANNGFDNSKESWDKIYVKYLLR
jgi:hypothetical protein